jgi:putative hydrolase of the HAD superfamily
MARFLAADPVRCETDRAGHLLERCRGQLGALEATVRRIAALQGPAPKADRVRQAVELRLAFARAHPETCGPVLPERDALRAAGVRLAVVSDASTETPRLWPASPLGPRFEATVFSCEQGFCKPDPRLYRRALERLQLPAERCAFVGDGGSHELTGATKVGLTAFLNRFRGDSQASDDRFEPDTEWTGARCPTSETC